MAVRRWQKSRRIYVHPRTGPQSAHLWWPVVAKLQAASVPVAWAAAPWDRRTGYRIAVSLNALLGRGHNNSTQLLHELIGPACNFASHVDLHVRVVLAVLVDCRHCELGRLRNAGTRSQMRTD